MSIQALNWALDQTSISNPQTRFVLVVLSNYADDGGQCYPSRETIQQKTGISIRSIQRHLNWLCVNGYISRKRGRNKHAQFTANTYKLNIKKPSATVSLGYLKPSANSDITKCHPVTKPSATLSPYPKEENQRITKEREHPRSFEIYLEVYPTATLDGNRYIQFINRLPSVDESVWRRTLEDWRLNGHKSHNLSGMIDRYTANLAKEKPKLKADGFIH